MDALHTQVDSKMLEIATLKFRLRAKQCRIDSETVAEFDVNMKEKSN